MVGGGQPLVEDDLQWKTTFSGEATSKQGRRLIFGILTLLTNKGYPKKVSDSDFRVHVGQNKYYTSSNIFYLLV